MRECPTIVTDGPSHPLFHGEPAFDGPGLAAATGGRLLRRGSLPIRGGAVDSRRVGAGNAFFALPGERTDGQHFLPEAVAAGAAALVVRDAPADSDLDALAGDGRISVIVVEDGERALAAAATAWRDRFDPVVVGVTGSLAKTSTKEQIAAALSERWTVLRNEGNENNEIGVPVTLLRLGPNDEAAVLEMGMYVAGDIALLCRLARPSIGVVTAVRPTHLSRAGTLEAIERGKRELVEALPASGTAILNADDPIVDRMRAHTPARVLGYGFGAAADVASGGDRIARRGRHAVPPAAAGRGRGSRLAHRPSAGTARTTRWPRRPWRTRWASTPTSIVRGLGRPWQAPHRTHLVHAGDWRILDDSYNAVPGFHGRRPRPAGDPAGTPRGRPRRDARARRADLTRPTTRSAAVAAGLVDRLVVVGEGARQIAAGAAAAGMSAGSGRRWCPIGTRPCHCCCATCSRVMPSS